MIICRPPAAIPERTAARLASHLRTHRTVLLAHDRHWPGAHLRLDVTHRHWRGLGDGHGQLTERQVRVECAGRLTRGRTRTTELLLPDEHGRVSPPAELLFTTAPVSRQVPVAYAAASGATS
ncbi:hypothetical protein [Kitasatospora camelliae]|uniref:Uncharacterized protein n=1 Tax=Kitasatospora camelliae TaxID=3156397 RepID=A0AAU8K9Y5_9ACTN